MTAKTFTELSARSAVLLAKQVRLLQVIREQTVTLAVLKEARLIGTSGEPLVHQPTRHLSTRGQEV